MTRSTQWLLLVCIGSYALSGCALLPIRGTLERSAEDETTAIAPAESTPEVQSVADNPESDRTAETSAEKSSTPASQTNYFSEGITRAQSAVSIGQSAQSKDDWNLAANRWKQAVLYMQQVPSADPNYATAQQKIQEYQQHLSLAERRAAGEVPNPSVTATSTERPSGLVASIPIIGQMGGTPVISATLTGNQGTQKFNMLFDTGASATLITPAMADAVGVLVTGSATVTVADGRQVEIPVGYVDTLQVGDLVVRDLWVGIGGDVALLGQDVYGEYGLSIGGNRIDLYQ